MLANDSSSLFQAQIGAKCWQSTFSCLQSCLRGSDVSREGCEWRVCRRH